MFKTIHYSILLKDTTLTIDIIADTMEYNINNECYQFYIDEHLIAIIPFEIIKDCINT